MLRPHTRVIHSFLATHRAEGSVQFLQLTVDFNLLPQRQLKLEPFDGNRAWSALWASGRCAVDPQHSLLPLVIDWGSGSAERPSRGPDATEWPQRRGTVISGDISSANARQVSPVQSVIATV